MIWKHKSTAFVVTSLFLLTGLAIVVYLNQYPYQPRERDYAYAASFYAYSIWIGFGVLAIFDFLSKKANAKERILCYSFRSSSSRYDGF
ncbi:MAG: hypothetical protein IPG89_13380 [Bacteroidetes bacterium]|nr:hypothetical protein [Bacteroidota bacterium]